MQPSQHNKTIPAKAELAKGAALREILAALPQGSHLLEGRRVGLEKEGLRVQADGVLSQTDHPSGLGSALCNANITTDYSEALLELVTPALTSASDAYRFLGQTHKFVYQNLPQGEYIWNTSMPCVVEGEDKIRIAGFGHSNIGTMKTVYRRGLGLRYGKVMQTIAGAHYNFSWPTRMWQALATADQQSDHPRNPQLATAFLDHLQGAGRGSKTDTAVKGAASHAFVSENYMATTRNLLRNGWLIPLLFGASPAICKTFLLGGEPLPGMQVHKGSTFYEPYATSLRMGDIGYNYKRDAASSIKVDYSSVDSYTADLHRLITTPHPQYREAGIKDADGEYQQLNDNVLQIENEYYSSVRPKQLTLDREPPVHAMRKRGIMYLELRSLDINLFEPLGVGLEQLHFLEVFMLHALLKNSPVIDEAEMTMLADNRKLVAHQGRDPLLQLQTTTGSRLLQECAIELFDEFALVAEFLDSDRAAANEAGESGARYSTAVESQRAKIADYSLMPSARVLDKMFSEDLSFFELAREHSQQAQQHCEAMVVDDEIRQRLQDLVSQSLQKQTEIETSQTTGFTEYLEQYLAQLETEAADPSDQ